MSEQLTQDALTGATKRPVNIVNDNPYNENGVIQWSPEWKAKILHNRAMQLGLEDTQSVPMVTGEPTGELLDVNDIKIDLRYQRLSNHRAIYNQVLKHGFDHMAAGAIDVAYRDGAYWAWDGGHRLNMALLAGVSKIAASVVKTNDPEAEARAFRIRNTESRKVDSVGNYKAGVYGKDADMLWVRDALDAANIGIEGLTDFGLDSSKIYSPLGIGKRVALSSFQQAMKWGGLDDTEDGDKTTNVDRLYVVLAGKMITDVWTGEAIPKNVLIGLTMLLRAYTVTPAGEGGVDIKALRQGLEHLRDHGFDKTPEEDLPLDLDTINLMMNPHVKSSRAAKDAAMWFLKNVYHPQLQRIAGTGNPIVGKLAPKQLQVNA